MDAGAAAGGVEGQADGSAGVIGDLGALVGGEKSGRIGGTGRDDGEVRGSEQSAKAVIEGERDVFFEEIVGQMGSRIGTAVCRVKQDQRAGWGWWSGFRLGREGDH